MNKEAVTVMSEEARLLQEYVKALENENMSRNKERTTLETQLASILEENGKLRERISSLPTQKQIEAYKKEIRNLKQHAINSEGNSKGAEKENQLTANTQHLNGLMAEKERVIAEWESRVMGLEEELRREREERMEVERDAEERRVQSEGLRHKIEFKNGMISELEKERNQLKMELDGVKAETHKSAGKVEGFYEAEIMKLREERDRLVRSSTVQKGNSIELKKTKQELTHVIHNNTLLEQQLTQLSEEIAYLKIQGRHNPSKPHPQQTLRKPLQPSKWATLQTMINHIQEQQQALKSP